MLPVADSPGTVLICSDASATATSRKIFQLMGSEPVPVVPTLAPNTRPSPCGKVRSPSLTRPMVVIVTALDGLHEQRDDRAPEGTRKRCSGRPAEGGAQGRSRQCLQADGHDGHAEQEQPDSAENGNCCHHA